MKRILVFHLQVWLALFCLAPLGFSRASAAPEPDAPTLVSIAVKPRGASIAKGTTQQFKAIGTYSNGRTKDVTSVATWKSSDPSVALISAAALATGVKAGRCNVVAKVQAIRGSAVLQVTPELVSITVTPTDASIDIGATQQFIATGAYSDASTQDITSSATWTSSDVSVLTIVASGSNAGNATGVAAGTSTVAASENGINGTAAATVTVPPPPPGAIAASFFGMTIGDDADYPGSKYPGLDVPIGAVGHPTLLAWSTIEPNRDEFDFWFYDKFAIAARDHNVPFMITFGWTPRWAVNEEERGNPDDCNPYICMIGPDDINDWINFVQAVVTHYSQPGYPYGHVQYYELWNEANDPLFWKQKDKNAEKLVGLAMLAYPIIHQDPEALLLAPSVTGKRTDARDWIRHYLSDLSGDKYADGGTFHGYVGSNMDAPPYPFPEDSGPSGYGDIVTRAATFRTVFDGTLLLGKPMFDTEGSWGQNKISDSFQQTAWLARWYLLQAGSGIVQSAYWFAWGRSNTKYDDLDRQWGYISDDRSNATPAGIAYGQMYAWLVGAAISPCKVEAEVWTCELIRSGGYEGRAVWLHSLNESPTDTATYDPHDSKFKQYRDLAGTVTTVSGTVTIGAQPILLETGPPP